MSPYSSAYIFILPMKIIAQAPQGAFIMGDHAKSARNFNYKSKNQKIKVKISNYKRPNQGAFVIRRKEMNIAIVALAIAVFIAIANQIRMSFKISELETRLRLLLQRSERDNSLQKE